LDRTILDWRTSSRCATGACLAAAVSKETVLVRDTKAENGPVLKFSAVEWKTFVSGLKHGDFQTP
jgi:hypothetical protein